MIKAVIFDMDGVLIESENEYADRFAKIYKKVGVEYTKEIENRIVGSSYQKTFSILEETLKEYCTVDEFWNFYNQDLEVNPIDYKAILDKDVLLLFDYLKQHHYQIALASSSSKEEIELGMKECEIYDYFDVVLSGHEFHESKPNPAIYLETMKHLGVNSDECIIVEDSSYGIEAGKKANVYTVAKKTSRFNIDQSKADERIDRLKEVIQIVERLNNK